MSIASPPLDAEEHRRVGHGGQRGETLGQLECRPVRVVAEHVVGGERAELRGDGICNLGPAVTDVGEPEPGGGVDVLVPVRVPHAASLATHEHELVAVDLPHGGERVPEARRGCGADHRRQANRLCAGRAEDKLPAAREENPLL